MSVGSVVECAMRVSDFVLCIVLVGIYMLCCWWSCTVVCASGHVVRLWLWCKCLLVSWRFCVKVGVGVFLSLW